VAAILNSSTKEETGEAGEGAADLRLYQTSILHRLSMGIVRIVHARSFYRFNWNGAP